MAFWILKTLQSVKFAGLEFVPAGVLLPPPVISLAAAIAAAIAGAWLFDRVERRPAG